uniref:hypothetical protein n=1 Tax=Anaeromyxobacter oryzisoli TaxID=2925408 RepID=UPI0038CC075A
MRRSPRPPSPRSSPPRGFPRHFYIRYHLYRHYFPLMALGRFCAAAGGSERPRTAEAA